MSDLVLKCIENLAVMA